MTININELAWEKMQNLIPVIVQDAQTGRVLMLGYMNPEALQKTLNEGLLTFYSRSKQRLWTKGETSGNHLKLVDISMDCDQDTLLILANPTGPVCHQGTETCFPETAQADWTLIQKLENLLTEREHSRPENSYTTSLFNAGIPRIAQKVGEEGVEVALAAVIKDDKELCGEMADLLFHMLVLLKARGLNMTDVIEVLKERHRDLSSRGLPAGSRQDL